MPVKRILRRFSAFRQSEGRLKSVFSTPRQQVRVRLSTEVRVKAQELEFTARSVQLGTQGMSLEGADQLSLAQPVLLKFNLPSGLCVTVSAVVWWKTKQLVGLRFDPRDHNPQLQECVQNLALTPCP